MKKMKKKYFPLPDKSEEIDKTENTNKKSSENDDFENKYLNTFESEDEEQMQYESEQELDDSDEN